MIGVIESETKFCSHDVFWRTSNANDELEKYQFMDVNPFRVPRFLINNISLLHFVISCVFAFRAPWRV